MEILLCDDHRLLAELVGSVLTDAGHDVSIVSSPGAAVREVSQRPVDVCLMDLGFPAPPDGEPEVPTVDAIHDMAEQGCRVLVLSGSGGSGDRRDVLAAGAEDFLLKDEPIGNVVHAVENPEAAPRRARTTSSRLAGGRWTHASLAEFLTPRERSVLEGLVQGESTALLATRLDVRPATARTHVQNLLAKLCVHSRLEAVALAVEHGVVRIADDPI